MARKLDKNWITLYEIPNYLGKVMGGSSKHPIKILLACLTPQNKLSIQEGAVIVIGGDVPGFESSEGIKMRRRAFPLWPKDKHATAKWVRDYIIWMWGHQYWQLLVKYGFMFKISSLENMLEAIPRGMLSMPSMQAAPKGVNAHNVEEFSVETIMPADEDISKTLGRAQQQASNNTIDEAFDMGGYRITAGTPLPTIPKTSGRNFGKWQKK